MQLLTDWRCRPVGPSSENVGLATELHDLAEDIVGEDGAAADNTLMGHTITDAMATGTMMKSEPTQKVFTETKSMTQWLHSVTVS